jgi:hypothetical protein
MAPEEAVDFSDAVLVLDSGPVFLEFAVIPVVEVNRVWQALADLNEAALGSSATGLADGLTAAEAFDAWSTTTLGLAGYLRAIGPGAAGNVLDSGTDYAEFTGNLAGMDSVYLSAFSSASRDLNLTGGSLERAAGILNQYGLPNHPSGGAAHTFINDVAHNHATLVNHSDLKSKIEQAHGNPLTILDVLAREGFGVAAAGAESLIPGSGAYVKGAGELLVKTSEGVVYGAGAGAAIGAGIGTLFGPEGTAVGAGVGAVVGAIIGGLVSLVTTIVNLVTGHGTKEVTKGDKVPVSPPTPVTDQHGHTTKVRPDGHTAPGPPAGGSHAPPSHGPPHPGPKGKEHHCPRHDDELNLELPAWGSDFELIPALGPNGQGLDTLVPEGTAVELPLAAQVSWDAQIIASGIWGDPLIKTSVPPGRTEIVGSVDVGRLTMVAEARRRVQLAEALTRHADQSATLEDALAAMRRSSDARPSRGLR